MRCVPSATSVVSHDSPNGPAVSSAPTPPPSTVNWRPATPTLSDAVAPSATVPDTVAPSVGAVSATLGAIASLPETALPVHGTGTIVVGLSAPGDETVRFAL